ncbi:uncharacterized protein LOC124117126 [Haliotis rufescens]|uniref:uncharacterized protein LOC124117126 n=1 Tax=Haliotis rufescens TaxID=6454 RepID=UPI001EB01745|nr:uncharacterized protein LOC124117126 [Haliotis rufescens]XP_046334829.1 uncharacterized protein LOC124117126 [Haliotis rufescens]
MSSNVEEKVKKRINKNYVKIIQTLDPKMMLTHLRQTGILTVAGYDQYYEELNNMLTHGKTKPEINIRLLEILYTRDKWWRPFFKALYQCEHQDIIDILEGALSQEEIEEADQPRSNRRQRQRRSERIVYHRRDRQPSDSESDQGPHSESATYHSLPAPRSRRRTSHEADQAETGQNSPRQFRSDCYAAPEPLPTPRNDVREVTQQNSSRQFRSDCYAAPESLPTARNDVQKVTRQNSPRQFRSDCYAAPESLPTTRNDLRLTQGSYGNVPNGYPQHPAPQDNPAGLHQQSHHQNRPTQTQNSAHYQNGYPHEHSFDRDHNLLPRSRPIQSTQSDPGDRPTAVMTGFARSSSSPAGPQNSDDRGESIPRQCHNQGQGQISRGQFSTSPGPVITSSSALIGHTSRQDRVIEGDPRTSGPLCEQALAPSPQANSSTSSICCSSSAPLTGRFTLNTPLKLLPEKLLKLLDTLDYGRKWRDLGSILTDKFLSEHHDKIQMSSDELKTKQVLDFFKEVEGERATLGRLIAALQEMQRQDLLDEIQEQTGLTFQGEHGEGDAINELRRSTSSNMVDLDIPDPDLTPASVGSAAAVVQKSDVIDQLEQSSMSSQTCQEADQSSCREEVKQSFNRTTGDEVSQSSITDARSGMYVSNQIILSQLEEEKKLDEAMKLERLGNQNRPVESPDEELQTNQEHGNPQSPESDTSDENNMHQNSPNKAEGVTTKMENVENQDTKPKPELESKVINTSSSVSPNRETTSHPRPSTTTAGAPNSSLSRPMNAAGSPPGIGQHSQAGRHYPPQLPVHAQNQPQPLIPGAPGHVYNQGGTQHRQSVFTSTKSGCDTSQTTPSGGMASGTVSSGQLPKFDKIQPISLQPSGTSNASYSNPGSNAAVSNIPNLHLLGPDSSISAGTEPLAEDETSPKCAVAQDETIPKTVEEVSDDGIISTENINKASQVVSEQHTSGVEDSTPPSPTGGRVFRSYLQATSDSSVFVSTLGTSILDDRQIPTDQEENSYIGEPHILTMSEASITPPLIATHELKVLQQSMSTVKYFEKVPTSNGADENDFLSLGESEEEEGETISERSELMEESHQGQGHSGAEGSRNLVGGFTVSGGTTTANSRSSVSVANGTEDTSSTTSAHSKGGGAASTTRGTSTSAIGGTSLVNGGGTSSVNGGTSATANGRSRFASVISSGFKLLEFFTDVTDVNKMPKFHPT